MARKGDIYKRSDFIVGSIEEHEVTVILSRKPNYAVISSTWPGRSIDLSRKYGKADRVSMHKGKITCLFWDVKRNWISFRSPRQDGFQPPQTATGGAVGKVDGK